MTLLSSFPKLFPECAPQAFKEKFWFKFLRNMSTYDHLNYDITNSSNYMMSATIFYIDLYSPLLLIRFVSCPVFARCPLPPLIS